MMNQEQEPTDTMTTEAEAEEQQAQAPTFPQTQVHVEERGVVIVTHMSAITQFVQIIPSEVMGDLIDRWQSKHRVNTTKLEIVRHGPSRRPRK